MNHDYEIIADMSIDIDLDVAKEYDLRFIPMEYSLGDDTFVLTEPAGYDTMMDFYEKLRNKVPTKTTQITPYNYIDYFTPICEQGKNILYFALSSGLSNTYESALSAKQILKEDFPDIEIEVIDTVGATIGIGVFMESILKNRAKGMSLKDNADWARENILKVSHWFKVVDLFYLMRGGRLSAPAATMGAALNLKPILYINKEGRLETVAKKRGDNQALKYLVKMFEEYYDPTVDPDNQVAYICSAGCPSAAAELKEALLAVKPDLVVKELMLGPVIGAHTGPDMLAVTFLGKERP